MSIHTAEAIALIHNRPGFAREVARQMGFTHVKEAKTQPILAGYGLTARQRDLLSFIKEYQAANQCSPSFDEMKDALGLASKSGIHRLISALEERGYVFRIPLRARCILLREDNNTNHQSRPALLLSASAMPETVAPPAVSGSHSLAKRSA